MSRHFGAKGPVYRNERARAIVIAAVCGVFSFVALAYVLLSSGANAPTPAKVVQVTKEAPSERVTVLIPTQSIEPGRPLEPAMFRTESRPKSLVQPRTVLSFEEIKGVYARTLIIPDQPLHNDFITKVRPVNEIVQQIPDGFRAVTIRVDQTSSVEGWARPGAKVDVAWISKINGKPAVTIIVENAKILSAERATKSDVKPGAPVPSTVTLLVSAEDAKKIQLASTAGSLSLNLRGENGGAKGSTGGTITLDDIVSSQVPMASREPECRGRVKTCNDQGICETLCMRADGSMVPIVPVQ